MNNLEQNMRIIGATAIEDKLQDQVPETIQAKLRNKLSPFWTLSDILSNDEHLSKLLSSEKGLNLIKDLAKQCESNKEVIIELIKKTNKDEN